MVEKRRVFKGMVDRNRRNRKKMFLLWEKELRTVEESVNIIEDFGGMTFKRIRSFVRMTQIEFAKALGITQQYLSHIESGREKASIKVLISLLDIVKDVNNKINCDHILDKNSIKACKHLTKLSKSESKASIEVMCKKCNMIGVFEISIDNNSIQWNKLKL